jgi:membrane protein DedA with SNARE-associated domain
MTSYFEQLVDLVGAHPQLSFLAVFLLALSEAVPVIGTVVPGSTLILAISALSTTAGITPWGVTHCCSGGSNCRRRLSPFGSDIGIVGRYSEAGRSIAFPG